MFQGVWPVMTNKNVKNARRNMRWLMENARNVEMGVLNANHNQHALFVIR
jgi:hypothetical protein